MFDVNNSTGLSYQIWRTGGERSLIEGRQGERLLRSGARGGATEEELKLAKQQRNKNRKTRRQAEQHNSMMHYERGEREEREEREKERERERGER